MYVYIYVCRHCSGIASLEKLAWYDLGLPSYLYGLTDDGAYYVHAWITTIIIG